MRILGFLLRVYRFPIPELLVVSLTLLSILSFSVGRGVGSEMSAFDYAAAFSALPSFASMLVLSIFLWEFLGAIRTPFADTILSMPVSRLDIYATYVIGSIAAPLAIHALPLIAAYIASSPYPLSDAAPAIAAILASSALYYTIAACTGLLAKSRGLSVAIAMLLWLSSPMIAALSIQVLGPTLAVRNSTGLYIAAILNPPTAIIYSEANATRLNIDAGSVLTGAAVIDTIAVLLLIIVTGLIVARRWEPV